MTQLIGLGVYTSAEAGRLLRIPPARISRWLRGRRTGQHREAPLWTPRIDLGDGRVYLDFRDLMEVRIVDRLIDRGVSPQRVKAAILLAKEILGDDRPLSTNRFRTDGRDVFLRVADADHDTDEPGPLLDLFRGQYAFEQVIDPLLRTIAFDDRGAPAQWWPLGRRAHILIDPARAFGQPVDAVSNVPTAVLAASARRDGIEAAARAYDVTPGSVRRSIEFEAGMERRAAA